MIDTAGQYHPFSDMCAYCEMNTGGQHQLNCPLFQPFPPQEESKVSVNIKINWGNEVESDIDLQGGKR